MAIDFCTNDPLYISAISRLLCLAHSHKLLEKLYSKYPTDISLQTNLGIIFLESNPIQSVALFEKILKDKPMERDVLLLLAEIYYKGDRGKSDQKIEKDLEKTEKYLSRALEVDSNNIFILKKLYLIFLNGGEGFKPNLEKAQIYLNRAGELNRDAVALSQFKDDSAAVDMRISENSGLDWLHLSNSFQLLNLNQREEHLAAESERLISNNINPNYGRGHSGIATRLPSHLNLMNN